VRDNFVVEDQNIMAEAENYKKYLFSLLSPYVATFKFEVQPFKDLTIRIS
jgi:hypothetical protein